MRLNELADNPGATKARTRVGRGVGSGKGKTAGRGVKGQKSRSGVAIKGFEGGQMPLHMRLPKRGFNKPNKLKFAEVTIRRLQQAIDAGVIKKGDVDAATLVQAGVIRRGLDGVRVIGGGELSAALNLKVRGATAGATKIVEKAGGSITLVDEKPARVKMEKAAKPAKAKPAKKAAPKKAEAKKEAPKKAAAKSDDAVSDYLEPTREYDAKADNAVVTKIEKYLGASLSNRDAKYVACSDQKELDTIVKGFMKKKMGIEDADAALEKVKAVCETMKPTRLKNRVTFYYLLAKNEGKLGEF